MAELADKAFDARNALTILRRVGHRRIVYTQFCANQNILLLYWLRIHTVFVVQSGSSSRDVRCLMLVVCKGPEALISVAMIAALIIALLRVLQECVMVQWLVQLTWVYIFIPKEQVFEGYLILSPCGAMEQLLCRHSGNHYTASLHEHNLFLYKHYHLYFTALQLRLLEKKCIYFRWLVHLRVSV